VTNLDDDHADGNQSCEEEHADHAADEEKAAAEAFDEVDGHYGHQHIDGSHSDGRVVGH
jgi:hypothetical protein